SARRKTKDNLFENVRKLVPGNDPTVTADGLELILLDRESLYAATRASPDAGFQRPQKIAEFQELGFLAAPCISGDGLTLYTERIDLKAHTVELLKFTRSSRRAKWGKPQPVKFSGLDDGKVPKLRFVHVTAEGRQAFTSTQEAEGDWQNSLIVVWRGNAAS